MNEGAGGDGLGNVCSQKPMRASNLQMWAWIMRERLEGAVEWFSGLFDVRDSNGEFWVVRMLWTQRLRAVHEDVSGAMAVKEPCFMLFRRHSDNCVGLGRFCTSRFGGGWSLGAMA